jgi:hypothetical protein
MANERTLIPVDASYINALGLVTYAFALCEWQVVWCCEKVKPGSVSKIVSEEKTAGQIAKYFADIVRNMPKSKERKKLDSLAKEFLILVDKRNMIIHGKPCTAQNGDQRLSGEGIIEISDLENAADAFAVHNRNLNSFFYGFLQNYVPK